MDQSLVSFLCHDEMDKTFFDRLRYWTEVLSSLQKVSYHTVSGNIKNICSFPTVIFIRPKVSMVHAESSSSTEELSIV